MIDWTPEIEQDIEDSIIAGESISKILKRNDIGEKTFYRRRANDESFDRTITRAQEIAQEAWVERTRDLAESATAETWQMIQMQIRNIQWIAGKHKPKKYGDKLGLTGGDGEGPIQIVSTIPRPPKD